MNNTSYPTSLPTSELFVHPALESFPEITPSQLVVLHASIEKQGILEPLGVTPDGEVYSGRARLRCAKVLNLTEVPVVVQPVKDAVLFAIESRVARGQLTKSGIAMLLFKQHPELIANKAGRPAKSAGVPQISGTAVEGESFTKLAARYQVDRDLFTALREARQTLTKAQWADFEHKVFDLEVPLLRAYAGIRGGIGMSANGRTETMYFAGWEDADGLWRRSLFAVSLTTVKNAVSRYSSEDKAVRQLVRKELVDLWTTLPEELRSACMEEQQ